MDTRYLKTLLVAAETGSFSQAAVQLNLTQSAVSQRIKFIEEQFGQQLFERTKNGLVATRAGSSIVEKTRAVLIKEQELLDELERFSPGKHLSFCCTPTFGSAFLPQVLNQFVIRNADLDDFKFIFAQPDQAVKGLIEGKFDLAGIEHCCEIQAEGLSVRPLVEDHLVFISSPSLGLNDEIVALADLQEHRLYARRDGCSSKQLLIRNLEEAGSSTDDFRSVIVSDDLRLTIESVKAGNGISFISTSLVAGQLAEGTLRAHRVAGFTQNRCRSVAYLSHRQKEPLVRTFLDCVENVCRTSDCTVAPAAACRKTG